MKEVAVNARLHLKGEVKDDWDGVGDLGKRKVARGHRRVWDNCLESSSLAGQPQDRITRSRTWTCNDEVNDCLHIYSDGSRKDDHTGYGFGVVDGDHLVHEE